MANIDNKTSICYTEEYKFIENYFESRGYNIRVLNLNDDDIIKVYNLIKYDILDPDNELSHVQMLCYGSFYRINEDYDKMKKYYLMGIDAGNVHSMTSLGVYYNYIGDYYSAEKFFFDGL